MVDAEGYVALANRLGDDGQSVRLRWCRMEHTSLLISRYAAMAPIHEPRMVTKGRRRYAKLLLIIIP